MRAQVPEKGQAGSPHKTAKPMQATSLHMQLLRKGIHELPNHWKHEKTIHNEDADTEAVQDEAQATAVQDKAEQDTQAKTDQMQHKKMRKFAERKTLEEQHDKDTAAILREAEAEAEQA